MADDIVILITAASDDEAARIARALVDERLAACANILPGVRSLFFWEGRTQDEREVLMVVKTRQALLDSIVRRVKALHSYTVPEIIALPVLGGSQDYLDWVRETVKER
jgi:periplasmic divalent cation tolerance protein